MPDFYPDIEDYLAFQDNSKSVSTKGLELFIYKVRAQTGLDYDVAAKLVRLLFQEIRNAMLRGDIVFFKELGSFNIFISKKKMVPKLSITKSFRNKLNGKK